MPRAMLDESFRELPLKRFSAPMKLLEYLACGLPIVSTSPYWKDLPGAVTTPVFHAAKGRVFAAANSWHQRGRQLTKRVFP